MKEGQDYYIEHGRWVFTAKFLAERGYCCGSGCRHCPYPKAEAKDKPLENEAQKAEGLPKKSKKNSVWFRFFGK